jgi:hypothetical protein
MIPKVIISFRESRIQQENGYIDVFNRVFRGGRLTEVIFESVTGVMDVIDLFREGIHRSTYTRLTHIRTIGATNLYSPTGQLLDNGYPTH